VTPNPTRNRTEHEEELAMNMLHFGCRLFLLEDAIPSLVLGFRSFGEFVTERLF
jgi:hypothetical protein